MRRRRTVLTGTRQTMALLRELSARRPELPLDLLPKLKAWQQGDRTGIAIPVDAEPGDWICFCEPGENLNTADATHCPTCGAKNPGGAA